MCTGHYKPSKMTSPLLPVHPRMVVMVSLLLSLSSSSSLFAVSAAAPGSFPSLPSIPPSSDGAPPLPESFPMPGRPVWKAVLASSATLLLLLLLRLNRLVVPSLMNWLRSRRSAWISRVPLDVAREMRKRPDCRILCTGPCCLASYGAVASVLNESADADADEDEDEDAGAYADAGTDTDADSGLDTRENGEPKAHGDENEDTEKTDGENSCSEQEENGHAATNDDDADNEDGVDARDVKKEALSNGGRDGKRQAERKEKAKTKKERKQNSKKQVLRAKARKWDPDTPTVWSWVSAVRAELHGPPAVTEKREESVYFALRVAQEERHRRLVLRSYHAPHALGRWYTLVSLFVCWAVISTVLLRALNYSVQEGIVFSCALLASGFVSEWDALAFAPPDGILPAWMNRAAAMFGAGGDDDDDAARQPLLPASVPQQQALQQGLRDQQQVLAAVADRV